MGRVEQCLFLRIHAAAELTAHAVQWLVYEKEYWAARGGSQKSTHTYARMVPTASVSFGLTGETKLTVDMSGVSQSLSNNKRMSPKTSLKPISPLLLFTFSSSSTSDSLFHTSFTNSCSGTFQVVSVSATTVRKRISAH